MITVKSIPNLRAVVFSGSAIFAGPAASSPFGLKALYPLSQASFAGSLARGMAAVNPKGGSFPILVEALTTDAAELGIRNKDPRIHNGEVVCKTAYEFFKMVQKAKELVPAIDIPFLCIHGGSDEVTLPSGSHYLMEKTSTPAELKSLETYPELRHELFHERQPERDQVMARVTTFFEKFLSESSAI